MNIVKSKLFWIVLAIAVLVVAFLAVVPKPIGTDLAKIGQGQQSVVFIYDPNLGISHQQFGEMNKARESIGEAAVFLIAQIGDPNSDSFRQRYQTQAAELLFFDSKGQLTERKLALVSARDLIVKLSGK